MPIGHHAHLPNLQSSSLSSLLSRESSMMSIRTECTNDSLDVDDEHDDGGSDLSDVDQDS